MTKDWLQNLVDKDKAEQRSARNKPTRRKSLLSETADQKIGRILYPGSTGKAAAQRMATAERQDAAHKARQAEASRKPAAPKPGTPPPSVFGKPKAPSFETKVPPPGRPKPQFVGLEEEPVYRNKNTGAVQQHHFRLAIDGLERNKPPRPPKADVIATPEMEQKIIKHLQSLDVPGITKYGNNEVAYTLGNDGEVRLFEGVTKRTPTQSSCKRGDRACLHIHPEFSDQIDIKTGLLKNGKKPDFAHSNVFGPLDWMPVEAGQPNFMVGPEGDLWALEAKGGKYVPRFIGKLFDILGK
ncbi:MAG: hypothetical protein ABF335_00150 [Alphaproteobacteria bacterium]